MPRPMCGKMPGSRFGERAVDGLRRNVLAFAGAWESSRAPEVVGVATAADATGKPLHDGDLLLPSIDRLQATKATLCRRAKRRAILRDH